MALVYYPLFWSLPDKIKEAMTGDGQGSTAGKRTQSEFFMSFVLLSPHEKYLVLFIGEVSSANVAVIIASTVIGSVNINI